MSRFFAVSSRRFANSSRAATAVAAVLVLASPGADVAAEAPVEVRSGGGVGLYSDGMATTIWSPYAKAGVTLPGEVAIDASWVSDVITSASVDVVTAATARMTEIRHELGPSLSWEKAFADVDLSLGYLHSFEKDSFSHIVQVGLSRELFRKALDLGLSYAFSYNRIGLAGEPRRLWRTLSVHTVDLAAAIVIDRRTLAEVVYSSFWAVGYQANPYRRVPVMAGENLYGASWIPEAVPGFRWRNALKLRVRRAFGGSWIGSLEYRFYADDWGLTGHTEKARLVLELPKGLAVEVRERFTIQGRASFYEERYTEVTRYRTRDRRLSSHGTGMAGAAVFWELHGLGPIEGIDLRLSFDFVGWYYGRFLEPDLSITSGAELRTLGLVLGFVAQLGLKVHL